VELPEDETFEGGLRVSRELRNVKVLIPWLLVQPILDAVVGANGECDVEEVDRTGQFRVGPSNAVDFHIPF